MQLTGLLSLWDSFGAVGCNLRSLDCGLVLSIN